MAGRWRNMGSSGVGMPQNILLNQFGRLIAEAFGDYPYQVGSSLETTEWRDVDVRLILEDEKYEVLFGKPKNNMLENKKWQAFCLAFSVLGKQMTGLPIDFQIQPRSWANEKYSGRRSSLIMCDGLFDYKEDS